MKERRGREREKNRCIAVRRGVNVRVSEEMSHDVRV
jgi:hypothetical protein